MSKIKKHSEEELNALLEGVAIPKTFKKGDIIEGTVVSMNDFGMIVNVGGRTEGIVGGKHLKLGGKKVVKKPGDVVLAYVLKPESEDGQIQLSVSKTGPELKWHELELAKKMDTSIKVRVIEANTGGVIVEINEGLRGFVPSSQLRNNRIYTTETYSGKVDAVKALQTKLAEMIGEELEVVVMEINKDKNKVILSEKRAFNDGVDVKEMEATLLSLKVGDALDGEVTGIAPFGLFVNAKGLEGLVHLSEISWDKVSNPADFYKVGEKVQVQVLGLQDNGKRVAYSIKRLVPDPWKNIVKKYKINQIVDGVVKSVADYGVFVKIEEGLNGLIHISELSNKLVKHPSQIVAAGDEIKVMIISISNEDRHLGLSLKRVAGPAEAETATTESTSSEASREMEGLDKLLNDTK
jgi:small subunit ribosomal protein S1